MNRNKQGNVTRNVRNQGQKIAEGGGGVGKPNSTKLYAHWEPRTHDEARRPGKQGNILADLLRAVLTWSGLGAAHLRGSGLLVPRRRITPAWSCLARKRKFSTLSFHSAVWKMVHFNIASNRHRKMNRHVILLFFFRFCRTWTKQYLITSQTRVKRVGQIYHRTILDKFYLV